MAIRSFESNQTKIYQIVFGFLLLALGFYSVRSLSSGSSGAFRMVAAIIALVGIVLALDKYYWILFVILINFGFRIPGLPFDSEELACLIVVAIHWMRVAFHREAAASWNRETLVAVPFILWVLFIFCLNPVGVHMFGSSTMGGRFYFQIFISFFAFLAISSLKFSEKDAKILFRTVFITCAVTALRSVLRHEVQAASDEYVTGSSSYYLIPMTQLYLLCCSRWSLSSIFSHFPRFVLFSATALLSLLSGKRQMFGRVVLAPLFRVFFTKKDFALTVFLGALGCLFVFAAIAGDGAFYSIPPGLRRTLAIVVPSYKNSADDGGIDDVFRREVRREAYDLIRRNPWVGRKGYSMDAELTAWQHFGGSRTANLYAGHAYAGNWHNMYLSYACDFGIPGLAFAVFFILGALQYAIKVAKTSNVGGYMHACCLFYAFKIFDIVIFGWVNGHSAGSTKLIFFNFGILIALANGLKVLHPQDHKEILFPSYMAPPL